MSDLKVKDNFKTAQPGGSASWTVGELVVPEGTVAKAFQPIITFIVNATNIDANGMALAAQNALLAAATVLLKTNVGTKAVRTVIDKDTLADLILDANSVLERDVIGGPGETASITDDHKGLGAALVAGENRLTIALPISLGHVEHIKESTKLFGAGHGQLLRMELGFKFARDVLKALDSNVVCTGYEVDLRVIPQRTNSDGEPETLVPEVEIVKGGEKDSVATSDSLVLTGNDTEYALADSPLTSEMEVTQGGQVVTKEATPKDIQARFLGMPNSSALEVGVGNSRTPLLRTGDTELKATKPGPVVVKMENHDKALVTRWSLLPLYSWDKGVQLLKAQAELQRNGGYVHMVNAAAVETVAVGEEHLPFTGWRYFTSKDTRFHTMPGLRMKKDGEPFIYVPPQLLTVIASEYGMASQTSLQDATAAAASALAVLVKHGKDIPFIFASSEGAPPQGEETPIFSTFRRMVMDFREDMQAARANQPEPSAARRKELKDAGKDPNELYAIPLK